MELLTCEKTDSTLERSWVNRSDLEVPLGHSEMP